MKANEKDSKIEKLVQNSKTLALSLALAFGVACPRKSNAQYAMSADGTFYEQVATKESPDFVRGGFSAVAAVATFGSISAYVLKKEKQELDEYAEHYEQELGRLENFKQEFLDGVPSDNSLMASLNKAIRGETKKEEEEEDEFEKNVRLFMEEEQKKEEDKKNNGAGYAKQGGATLLERPSDPDGNASEEWMKDVVFEDKPAEIDAEQLKALQRMFGGSDSSK
eukprot:752190-Hanusia_phi.AAC.2